MYLAPCKEVGGKRFTFLSRYLSKWCDDYHILARRERASIGDATAFNGNVHRVRMFPHYPPIRSDIRGIRRLVVRAWERWLCLVDTGTGFVIPATMKGIHLCRKHRLNVVIVTVPDFSSIIAATIVTKVTRARLILDYRDPWTNHRTEYPKPFGRWLSRFFERTAIRHATATVVCTDIMRDNFVRAFGDIAPSYVEVIHNGFEDYEERSRKRFDADRTTMIYAGNFHGRRRLSVIALAMAEMAHSGDIAPDNFRFHIFSQLGREDYALMDRFGVRDLIEVHKPVPYHEIKKIMSAADILFLPSGDEVAYAIPYKFFDYLSVRRPILAVAPRASSIGCLMRQIDCGELAEFGEYDEIRRAIRTLLKKTKTYSFKGSQNFRWKNSVRQYYNVIECVINT